LHNLLLHYWTSTLLNLALRAPQSPAEQAHYYTPTTIKRHTLPKTLLASLLPLIFKPNDTAINNRQHRGRRRELSCALPRIFTFLWLFFCPLFDQNIHYADVGDTKAKMQKKAIC